MVAQVPVRRRVVPAFPVPAQAAARTLNKAKASGDHGKKRQASYPEQDTRRLLIFPSSLLCSLYYLNHLLQLCLFFNYLIIISLCLLILDIIIDAPSLLLDLMYVKILVLWTMISWWEPMRIHRFE